MSIYEERDGLLAEVKRLTRLTQVIMATGDADHERLSNLLHLTLDERNERDATIERVKDVVRAERQDDSTEPSGSLRRAYQQGRRDMTRVFRAAIEQR